MHVKEEESVEETIEEIKEGDRILCVNRKVQWFGGMGGGGASKDGDIHSILPV